jgi:preprotein translocase subunit SecD
MNRYPVWKYLLMAFALFVGLLYTAPNLFGEAPAVQVSSAKASMKVDASLLPRVERLLKEAGLNPEQVVLDGASVRVRLADTETQLKAKDALQRGLNPDASDPFYTVALNLQSRSPSWLRSLHAQPMYLGLDLRGGVHFLMQIDMARALDARLEALVGDMRLQLREKNLRHAGIARSGKQIELKFAALDTRAQARKLLEEALPDLQFTESADGSEFRLLAEMRPDAIKRTQEFALKQNITTLHNRINELGVSEPVIQQQGIDRIVVQLPGVQDTAKAKEILGRTATLQMRMVDESAEALAAASGAGAVPFGSERYVDRNGQAVIVRKAVILSGNDLTDAQAGFDQQTQEPKVDLTVSAKGGRIMRDISRENIGKRMAILLFERDRGELLTAPVIRGELGNRFQISGRMNPAEASDLALLLRAGSLAAPMEIIEERTIGPSLGKENIDKGFNSVSWGFAAIALFMCAYYMMFGLFSTLALGLNLLLLVAVLSMLQATLTLPGIAAIALTLGMAIDANVLINERVREELRNGASPQTAISTGYERAWGTIVDSNVTTLIAGLALLVFGSGAIRGFAVVHCLGILTSMFSAVFFSRGLVNLWYGRQKKLQSVSIGQVWKPAPAAGHAGAAAAAVAEDAAPASAMAAPKAGSAKSNGKPTLAKRPK